MKCRHHRLQPSNFVETDEFPSLVLRHFVVERDSFLGVSGVSGRRIRRPHRIGLAENSLVGARKFLPRNQSRSPMERGRTVNLAHADKHTDLQKCMTRPIANMRQSRRCDELTYEIRHRAYQGLAAFRLAPGGPGLCRLRRFTAVVGCPHRIETTWLAALALFVRADEVPTALPPDRTAHQGVGAPPVFEVDLAEAGDTDPLGSTAGRGIDGCRLDAGNF